MKQAAYIIHASVGLKLHLILLYSIQYTSNFVASNIMHKLQNLNITLEYMHFSLDSLLVRVCNSVCDLLTSNLMGCIRLVIHNEYH